MFFVADGLCLQVFVCGGKLETVVSFSLIYSDEDRLDVFKGVVFWLRKAMIPRSFLGPAKQQGPNNWFCFFSERSFGFFQHEKQTIFEPWYFV